MTTLLDPTIPMPPAAAVPSRGSPADDGDAVLRDLSAPIGPRSPSLIVGLALAFLTFGILPALLWPLRFAKFAQQQKRDLLRLAKWVSLTAPHPATKRLSEAAAMVEFRSILWVVALTCCAAMAVVYLALVPTMPAAADAWEALFSSGFRGLSGYHGTGAATLYLAWSIGLCAAYLLQWLQVQLHARSVRKLLDSFNEVVIDEALAPVFLEPVGFSVGLFWLLAGVLLVALGAPWGICFMLAGGVQSRYVRRVSPRLRSQLAQRVRDMMLLRRPSPAADARGYTRTRCETPGCRMPLPASARFCPRCGVRSAGPVDRVA